jgi:hypothetical protein
MDLYSLYDMPSWYLVFGLKVFFVGISVALLIATRGAIAKHI